MPLLVERDRQTVQERLKMLKGPVKLVNFTQELACPGCRETTQLLTEVAELSGKVKLETHNYAIDREKVEHYSIERVPATVVEGKKDFGIRFYGLPAGFEFATLLEDMIAVSKGEHGLTPETVKKLATLDKPVHLQVLVTPTCPYCPAAVRLAHSMAMASDFVTADMIEASEFPDLVFRYEVRGVPRTIANESVFIDGAVSEEAFVEQVLKAASASRIVTA